MSVRCLYSVQEDRDDWVSAVTTIPFASLWVVIALSFLAAVGALPYLALRYLISRGLVGLQTLVDDKGLAIVLYGVGWVHHEFEVVLYPFFQCERSMCGVRGVCPVHVDGGLSIPRL